jgi:hypothetical protein
MVTIRPTRIIRPDSDEAVDGLTDAGAVAVEEGAGVPLGPQAATPTTTARSRARRFTVM